MKIRVANSNDGPSLGKMGALLAQFHHRIDAARFMLPEGIEEGYRRWLLREAASKDAVVLVAEDEEKVVGYAYGRLEERDWNALRDACGALHDIWVEPTARRKGAARALCEEMATRLKTLGAPRVVLSTATSNESAQKLFASLGFRATMTEMTREL